MLNRVPLSTVQIGHLAENFACEYLIKEGFSILVRNWRNQHHEIDIVMESSQFLHFLEVKASFQEARLPNQRFNAEKRKSLRKAAGKFLRIYPLYNVRPIQFDLITVYGTYSRCVIEHKQDVYFPGLDGKLSV